jgi:hypothetical protein
MKKKIQMKLQKTFPSKLVLKPKEETIHAQVVKYLKLQYPKVLFRTDFAAGIKMTIGQAVKHKKLQQSRAWPDLFIAKPANGYSGLFLELKRDVSEIFKKNGDLVTDSHVQEQAALIKQLNELGYKAMFACGFDHARKAIDEYLR